jgi:hypothetical protein
MSKLSGLNGEQKRRVASRSKIRAKFVLESLRQEESKLRLENALMKKILFDSFPSHVAQEIISECCSCTCLSVVKEDDSCEEEKSVVQDVSMEQLSMTFLHDNLQPLIQVLDRDDDESYEFIDDHFIIDTDVAEHNR